LSISILERLLDCCVLVLLFDSVGTAGAVPLVLMNSPGRFLLHALHAKAVFAADVLYGIA
jgi:hypothetical protein